MRTKWRIEGDQLVVDAPRAGFSTSELGPAAIMALIAALVGAGAFLCFLLFIARRADVAPGFKWLLGIPFAVACFTLPAVILFEGILWPALCLTRVIASPAGLRARRRLGPLHRTKEIRADAVEELALTRLRAPAITARGAMTAIRFGQGLPEGELEWIRAALKAALAK
jgi:hypothetical protein